MRDSLATPLPHAASTQDVSSDRRDLALAWLTGLSAVAIVFSIAASQILLGAALAVLLLSRRPLDFPPRLKLPLLTFAGWTLLALAFSDSPVSGLSQIKKFFLFLVIVISVNGFRNQKQIWRTIQGILVGGVVAAGFGLAQFTRDYFNLIHRGFYENYVVHQITGFMGHWMTFGGQLMIVLLLLLALILFSDGGVRKRWGWIGVVLLSIALLAAFTRGIWLGSLAGATFLVGSYRRWMVVLIPAAVLLLYLVSPSWLQRRDESIFKPEQDSSSRSRLVMIQVGIRMIEAHPIFGLGPERIGPEFKQYVPVGVTLPPAWYGHLHDTFLQIAAERGIPCLIILLWFFYEALLDGMVRARSPSPRERALGYGAVASTVGLMVSGLFEYNFGDSEVLMIYLSAISIPYAWYRLESSASQPSPTCGSSPVLSKSYQ